MSMEFATIASGSSGNSIYIGSNHTKILIDAGLSGKKIETGLKELSLTGWDIDAIFVTHEHIDHVDGIGVLSRRYDIPIYATEGTWSNMPDKVGEIKHKNRQVIYSGENCILNDLCIHPFDIPHDASEPVGYNVVCESHKVTVATDIGHISQSVAENVTDSDILLIESNHDINMLKNGPYPYNLKQRVLSDVGHLSNERAGELLKNILDDRLKYIFLGHLSNENNTPMLAFNTVKDIISDTGAELNGDLEMYVAPRYGVKRRIVL